MSATRHVHGIHIRPHAYSSQTGPCSRHDTCMPTTCERRSGLSLSPVHCSSQAHACEPPTRCKLCVLTLRHWRHMYLLCCRTTLQRASISAATFGQKQDGYVRIPAIGGTGKDNETHAAYHMDSKYIPQPRSKMDAFKSNRSGMQPPTRVTRTAFRTRVGH